MIFQKQVFVQQKYAKKIFVSQKITLKLSNHFILNMVNQFKMSGHWK